MSRDCGKAATVFLSPFLTGLEEEHPLRQRFSQTIGDHAEQAREEKTLGFTTEDVEKAIHEARSDLAAGQARLVLAEKDHTRYATLYEKQAATHRQSRRRPGRTRSPGRR